uniref:Uncharacterized protein n=1 Tax=Tanacetum cinerariifolium TaxID=118510 RepID=A0A699JBG6_TANCI|nr:hypothetical protein [Tanacetum cinerariifolium]
MQQFGALLPIELTNEEIKNSNAYKEYYAIAIRDVPPKPKASVWKTRSSSDTSITPPTVAIGVPDVPTDESEEELSWNSTDDEGADDEGKYGDDDEEDEGDDGEEGDGDNDDEDDVGKEGNDDDDDQEVERDDDKDDEEEGGDDEQEYDDEEYAKETRDEESFDPILKTPENRRGIQATLEVEDSHVTLTQVNPDGQQQSSSVSSQFMTSMLNPTLDVGMESIFKTTSQMNVQTPTSVAPLPMTAPTMTPSTFATITTTSQAPILPTTKIIKEQVKEQVKVYVSKILPRIEQTVNEQLEAEVLTRSSHSSKTSYAVAADLFETELKKILIEKLEGKNSIQRSDEQRNLYKALVEAYEFNKIILDTYEDTVTLNRRRDDDADKDEEPSAGPDRGSKRCREGKEPESASAPTETTTRSAGRSTQGSQS